MAIEQELKNEGESSTTTPPAGSQFLQTIQEKLLSSDVVSSQDTALEGKLKAAIGAEKEAGIAGRESITGEAERLRGEFKETRVKTREDILARQRGVGFETTRARLEEFDENTQKTLKDLADRKTQALRAGDTASASRIAALEIKELEFNQRAKQQTFANTLQLAGFGLQMETAERTKFFQQRQEDRLDRQGALAETAQDLQAAKFEFDKIQSDKRLSLDERTVAVAEGNLRVAESKANLLNEKATQEDTLDEFLFQLEGIDANDIEDKAAELELELTEAVREGTITAIGARQVRTQMREFVERNKPEDVGGFGALFDSFRAKDEEKAAEGEKKRDQEFQSFKFEFKSLGDQLKDLKTSLNK